MFGRCLTSVWVYINTKSLIPTTSPYEVPAVHVHVNTSKAIYTITSVIILIKSNLLKDYFAYSSLDVDIVIPKSKNNKKPVQTKGLLLGCNRHVIHSIDLLFCDWQIQNLFKGIYLSKALTCMPFFRYKQKCFFIKETDTFEQLIHLT